MDNPIRLPAWARCSVRVALIAALLGSVPGGVSGQTIWVFQDESGNLHFSDTRYHGGYQRHSSASYHNTTYSAVSSDRRWDHLIRRASQSHGVSPGLLKAVIHVESQFDPRAVSHKGARGLMQLMPRTAGELGVSDPFNPWENIDAGTRYLERLVRRFEGDLNLGLAAYHAGPGVVEKYNGVPPYKITHRYVRRVLELSRRYDADFR